MASAILGQHGGKDVPTNETSGEIAKGGRRKRRADMWGLGVHRAPKRRASSVTIASLACGATSKQLQ